MTITLTVAGTDISSVMLWQSLNISEVIGQPDTLSCDIIQMTDGIKALFASDALLYALCMRDGDILFSGTALGIHKSTRKDITTLTLRCTGWERYAPKRLVGVPDGTEYILQEADDPERLPTAVFIDSKAVGTPTAAGVQELFANYWTFPTIDTSTYVFDVLPAGVDVDELHWSGTDVDGATSDMAAAGSAAAVWWFANDAPGAGDTEAPHLALHFGVIVMPAEGESDDDLLAGFPAASTPSTVAPYAISDTPDWVTSIMSTDTLDLDIDHEPRLDAVYVRGATGWTYNPEIPPDPTPGHYITTFTGETTIYARHETGYIGVNVQFGSAGLEVYTNPTVIKRDPVHLTGGTFYEIKTLTPTVFPAGWLIRATDPLVSHRPVVHVTIPANVTPGGTGWVGAKGGIWGDGYVDAPGAITSEQRDAFGQAYLASRQTSLASGTIIVEAFDGWHKGQAVPVTDSELDLNARWLLIREVAITSKDPTGEAMRYQLTVGDVLDAQLGYSLRNQRLKDQRKKIEPMTRFIPYVGDLLLAPGAVATVTMQGATDAGKAVPVRGVGAKWGLLINGVEVDEVTNEDNKYYLTDLISITDEVGQITANLHASLTATAADAANPHAEIMPKVGA